MSSEIFEWKITEDPRNNNGFIAQWVDKTLKLKQGDVFKSEYCAWAKVCERNGLIRKMSNEEKVI